MGLSNLTYFTVRASSLTNHPAAAGTTPPLTQIHTEHFVNNNPVCPFRVCKRWGKHIYTSGLRHVPQQLGSPEWDPVPWVKSGVGPLSASAALLPPRTLSLDEIHRLQTQLCSILIQPWHPLHFSLWQLFYISSYSLAIHCSQTCQYFLLPRFKYWHLSPYTVKLINSDYLWRGERHAGQK